MASRAGLSGLALAEIAAGVLLAWSGIENATITATLSSIIAGQAPHAGPPGPSSASSASSANLGIPPTAAAIAGSGSVGAAAADALKYRGAGYVWGGAPASGIGHWDCSSFANWVYGHDLGLAIPGIGAGSYLGATHGPTTISWLSWAGLVTVGHDGNQAQAGDLAIWQTHMGICLGPNQMISAQNPADGTQVSGINGFIPEILFIRRYANPGAGTRSGQ